MNKKAALNIYGIILIIGIIFLATRFSQQPLYIVGDSTTYNSFAWESTKLIYASTFTPSNNPDSTRFDSLTNIHIYQRYYGSPNFGYGISNEPQAGTVNPPEVIVQQYPDPNELAKNMKCRVYGKVIKMTNYYNDVYETSIPYDIQGARVDYVSGSGFRCIIESKLIPLDPSRPQEGNIREIDKPIFDEWCRVYRDQGIYSKHYPFTPQGCYGWFPLIQGNVEFSVPSTSSSSSSSLSCGWCGNECVDKSLSENKYCIALAPPEGMSCIKQDNSCIAVQGTQTSQTISNSMSLWEQLQYLIEKFFSWILNPFFPP